MVRGSEKSRTTTLQKTKVPGNSFRVNAVVVTSSDRAEDYIFSNDTGSHPFREQPHSNVKNLLRQIFDTSQLSVEIRLLKHFKIVFPFLNVITCRTDP
jgi:hypothetical protein